MTTLSSAITSVEQRVTQTRSNKISVRDVGGNELGSMDRPFNMTHDDFVRSYNILVENGGDRTITSMSALRAVKRGQALDDAPSTLKIVVQ